MERKKRLDRGSAEIGALLEFATGVFDTVYDEKKSSSDVSIEVKNLLKAKMSDPELLTRESKQ